MKAKKEGTKEMVEWINSLKVKGKRKIPLSSRIDEIVYGVKR